MNNKFTLLNLLLVKCNFYLGQPSVDPTPFDVDIGNFLTSFFKC